VKALAPVVVGGDVEARDAGSCIDELRDFLFEGHAGDEVVDALLGGERGVEVGQRLGGLGERTRREEDEREKSSESLKLHDWWILQGALVLVKKSK
jgi:hypothetical protein